MCNVEVKQRETDQVRNPRGTPTPIELQVSLLFALLTYSVAPGVCWSMYLVLWCHTHTPALDRLRLKELSGERFL